MRTPIAVVCSDIHLSLTPPPARAREKDWFAAMARPLAQVTHLATKHSVPIICAGDVFDRWDPKPELINFALEHLPRMYAVPGQHDLPYHVGADVMKSAYGTMVLSRVITPIEGPTFIGEVALYGFGWGEEVHPPTLVKNKELSIAVVHAYCWVGKCRHEKAEESQNVRVWLDKLKGYNVAVFGDNHRGFHGSGLINCGGLMRRRTDDADRNPMVGIIWSDGYIEKVLLDTSQDVFDVNDKIKLSERDDSGIRDFVAQLVELKRTGFDFKSAVRNYIETHKPPPEVTHFLLSSLE